MEHHDTLVGDAGREVAALRRAYSNELEDLLRDARPDLTDTELRIAGLSLFGMLD